MQKMEVLVLECPWSGDFSDHSSVRDFFQGWGKRNDVGVVYRAYHSRDDLEHWLDEFLDHAALRVAYIAGHGAGGKLETLYGSDIALADILKKKLKKPGPKGCHGKGVLLGSCEVGGVLSTELLKEIGTRVDWLAGYEKEIPWMESTLCDLLFLEYLLRGRRKRNKDKTELLSDYQGTKSAAKAAEWVKDDFPLATMLGFVVKEKE